MLLIMNQTYRHKGIVKVGHTHDSSCGYNWRNYAVVTPRLSLTYCAAHLNRTGKQMEPTGSQKLQPYLESVKH